MYIFHHLLTFVNISYLDAIFCISIMKSNKMASFKGVVVVSVTIFWNQCKYNRVFFCDGSVLQRFTFTTPVQSDRALPTCGPSLSQLNCPFSTHCASGSFPLCMCFLFCYCSAFLLSWLWFFPPMTSIKKTETKKKIKTVDVTFFLDVFWTTTWAFFSKIKSDMIDICFNYLCNFLYN